jgi:hypothetical protein
LPDYSNI